MTDSGNASHDRTPFSAVDAEVKQALASLRKDTFAPGFENRVLTRWNRERAASTNTFTFIERRAWQFLPVAIAASLMIAVYSVNRNATSHASLVARALGWPSALSPATNVPAQPETYETVYATLYGLPLVGTTQGVR